jgi:hypothetical protein
MTQSEVGHDSEQLGVAVEVKENVHSTDSVEERIQELLRARRKLFFRATLKAARWLPIWLPAMLFSRGTSLGAISVHLKGHYFRGDRVVVWLRRFNISRMQAFYFNIALNEACRGFGIPITIQDSSVKVSWHKMAVELIREPLIRLFFVFFVICTVLIWLLPEDWAYRVAVSIWILMVGIMTWRAYRRAFMSLDAGTARNQMLDLISKIRCKEDLYDGVSVVRCANSFWRDIVGLAIANADLALVDITDITENLKWELEQLIRKLEPEAVILICAHSEGFDQELPKSTRQEVVAVIGYNTFLRCQVFTYPVSYGPLGVLNAVLFQKVKRKLTRAIARAIVTSTSKPIERGSLPPATSIS